MPVRVILNVVYFMAVEGMDTKQRKEFDDKLYGFDVQNEAGTAELWKPIVQESGGES